MKSANGSAAAAASRAAPGATPSTAGCANSIARKTFFVPNVRCAIAYSCLAYLLQGALASRQQV